MKLVSKYWWFLAILAGFILYLVFKIPKGVNPAPTMSPVASSAASGNIYTIKNDSSKGDYLADFQGMSLYIFDNDTTSESTCYDSCAARWPYYTSGATAQENSPINITVVTRKDGSKQFAWKGRPLYYYAPDKKSGDVLGDGVGGIWHLVKP